MLKVRKAIIAAFTFLGGIYFFLEFVLPETIGGYRFNKYHEQISLGVAIVGTMALGLGIINILTVHGVRVLRQQRGWANSAALLLGLVVMLSVELLDFVGSERALNQWKPLADLTAYAERIRDDYSTGKARTPDRAEKLQLALEREAAERGIDELRAAARASTELPRLIAASADVGQVEVVTGAVLSALRSATAVARDRAKTAHEASGVRAVSRVLYDGLFTSLSTAMFALLAFFIATAAYRSFRIKSVEATVIMVVSVIVILGQIPHGPLYISEDLTDWRLWLMENINTPGNRAIYFGSAVAGLAMAVRMWLSLERSPLATAVESEDTERSP